MASNLFKIVRFRCGGIDVHKNLVVCAASETDFKTYETTFYTSQYTCFNDDLDKMCKWFEEHGVKEVAMESTGKYWIPVTNKLEEHHIKFTLVHPKYVKAASGQKNDKADARFICSMFAYDMAGLGSVILPKVFRENRDLARRYWKLGYCVSSEKCRLQNCMTMSNLSLDSVFTDPFGKSAQAVMQELLSNRAVDDQKILSLVHGRCKNKDKLLDAIHGSNITPDQHFKMADITQHLNELEEHRDAVFGEILVRLEPYMDSIILLTSIPGIQLTSAVLIVSEIGTDMSFWKTGRQLSAWAGLTPNNDQSHNKKKSTRITKAGTYLKPLMVQCALAAIKCKGDKGYFAIKYCRIKKRRGHKKAIVAIARMMMISIYHVLKDHIEFKPSDYDELINPKPKKAKEFSESDAINLLKSHGYDVSLLHKTTITDRTIPSPAATATSTAA